MALVILSVISDILVLVIATGKNGEAEIAKLGYRGSFNNIGVAVMLPCWLVAPTTALFVTGLVVWFWPPPKPPKLI
jgi:hypothetical protein